MDARSPGGLSRHIAPLLAAVALALAIVSVALARSDGDAGGAPAEVAARVDEERGSLRVQGRGFDPNREVFLYVHSTLATEGAEGDRRQLVAKARTDPRGAVDEVVQIPDRWPDGAPITADRLAVLVVSVGVPTRAGVAAFDYEPPRPATPAAPTPRAWSLQELRAELLRNVSSLEPGVMLDLRLEGGILFIATSLEEEQSEIGRRVCDAAASGRAVAGAPERIVVLDRGREWLADCGYRPARPAGP